MIFVIAVALVTLMLAGRRVKARSDLTLSPGARRAMVILLLLFSLCIGQFLLDGGSFSFKTGTFTFRSQATKSHSQN